jgi:hypothetical protein
MTPAPLLATPERMIDAAVRQARFEVVADQIWGAAPRPGNWRRPPLPPRGRLPHTPADASLARMRAVCALLALDAPPQPDLPAVRRLIRGLAASCAPSATRANKSRGEPTLVKMLAAAWTMPPHPAMETLLLMGAAAANTHTDAVANADLHATLGMSLACTERAFAGPPADTPHLNACTEHLARALDKPLASTSFHETARAFGAHHGLPDAHIPSLVGLGALVPVSRAWLDHAQESLPSP